MIESHWIVFAILGAALTLFVWGRWRYDVVAATTLVAGVVAGVVPAETAFSGFGHPAVITVAAVLAISRALTQSGAGERATRPLLPLTRTTPRHIAVFGGLGALFSTFMNNVGALALLLPPAVAATRRHKRPSGAVLMPLAFATLLGGMVTLIGTPPNLIVAAYRNDVVGTPFGMFDFTPVGSAALAVGLVYLVAVGWRLVPTRRSTAEPSDELFHVADYVTEFRVPADAKAVGRLVRDLERASSGDGDVMVLGVIRGERRLLGRTHLVPLAADDIVVIEADAASLTQLADEFGLELVGAEALDPEHLQSEEVRVVEAVVLPGGVLEGRSPEGLGLRSRYGLNLIAVARSRGTMRERLGRVVFRAGDVLLLQGDQGSLPETLKQLGALPLASRDLSVGTERSAAPPALVFLAAIAATAVGWLPAHVAFVAAVVALVLLGLLTLRDLYASIEWPVIVLLAALLPLGDALQSTGGAEWLAERVLGLAPSPTVTLGLLIATTMLLTNILNNAAAAVVMSPIALGLASQLGVSPDAMLMAVAVSASAAFLTPIGHQANMLVMGPGGYAFGDYWRVGLPLQILVGAVAVVLVPVVWPL